MLIRRFAIWWWWGWDEEDNEEDEEEDGSEYDQGPKLDNKSAKKNKKEKSSKKGGMQPRKENYDLSKFNLIFKVYILEIIQMIICLFQALRLTLMERARHPLSRRPSRAQNLCREYIAFDSTFNDICFTIYQSRSWTFTGSTSRSPVGLTLNQSVNSSRSATPKKFAAAAAGASSSGRKRKVGTDAGESSSGRSVTKHRHDLANSSSAASSPAAESR